MRDVILQVVDEGQLFEIQPDFAKNMVVGFARLGGSTVGVVANNPAVLAGCIDIDAAIKASRALCCYWPEALDCRARLCMVHQRPWWSHLWPVYCLRLSAGCPLCALLRRI